jgi:hypothetical protein
MDLKWLHKTLDCGSNSCKYKPKDAGGMRTNGGCGCFSDLPIKKRLFVEKMFFALKDQQAQLDRAMEKLENYHWDIHRVDFDEHQRMWEDVRQHIMEGE